MEEGEREEGEGIVVSLILGGGELATRSCLFRGSKGECLVGCIARWMW